MLKGVDALIRRQQEKKAAKQPSPFVDFDKFIPQGNMGNSEKSFVQTKGWYLREFFRDIRSSKNKSFVTCVDDLIKDETTTEEAFYNFPVSSIVFVGESANETYNVLASANLANMMGIRTQYVSPHKTDPKKYIAIDFLQGDQTIENFYELTGLTHSDLFPNHKSKNTLKTWLQPLNDVLIEKMKHLPKTQGEKILFDVIADFVKLYIFKRYVILDADIAGVNMGFVHSKSDYSDLIVAPAFDYEYSFFYPITDMVFSNLDQDVAYLYDYNPSIFSEVQKTFSLNLLPNSKQTKEIQNIFSEYPYTRGSENSNIVINNLINLGASFERVLSNAANISPAEMGC